MLMLGSRAEPVKDSLRRALSGASLTEPARPQKRISREEGEGRLSKGFPGKLTSLVEHTQGAGHQRKRKNGQRGPARDASGRPGIPSNRHFLLLSRTGLLLPAT